MGRYQYKLNVLPVRPWQFAEHAQCNEACSTNNDIGVGHYASTVQSWVLRSTDVCGMCRRLFFQTLKLGGEDLQVLRSG